MSLHDQIMNIPVEFSRGEFKDNNEYLRYKEGHRDARHAAAELSLKAEARIEELETTLKQLLLIAVPVSNTAYNLAWQHEQQDAIHKNVSLLDALRVKAYKILEEK